MQGRILHKAFVLILCVSIFLTLLFFLLAGISSAYGNLLTITESRTGVTGAKTTNLTYDRQGRLASRTDENGQAIGYRYYSSGKVWKIIYPGGTESGVGHVEYTWWQDGNLKEVIAKLDSTTDLNEKWEMCHDN